MQPIRALWAGYRYHARAETKCNRSGQWAKATYHRQRALAYWRQIKRRRQSK